MNEAKIDNSMENNSNKVKIEMYDNWLEDNSEVAALVMRQWFQPVEGEDAVIFPPTYPEPEKNKPEVWLGYNIDTLSGGPPNNVCLIDSVGSQANRMEAIFKEPPYCKLVPEVVIGVKTNTGTKKVNLLDVGHRAADAIVRFSNLRKELEEAFRAFQENGNAEPLARIAPTSIVFGCWDSRGTQAKLPRIVRSVIRAFQVEPLHRSAQYIPPIDYVGEGLIPEPKGEKEKELYSQLGLRHVPATWVHGGVIVRGEIRRDAVLNLTAIRLLRASDQSEDRVMSLRRYILGLALVVFTAPLKMFLREGCELVLHPERKPILEEVRYNGSRCRFEVSHENAKAYAQLAAERFGVRELVEATFKDEELRGEIGK